MSRYAEPPEEAFFRHMENYLRGLMVRTYSQKYNHEDSPSELKREFLAQISQRTPEQILQGRVVENQEDFRVLEPLYHHVLQSIKSHRESPEGGIPPSARDEKNRKFLIDNGADIIRTYVQDAIEYHHMDRDDCAEFTEKFRDTIEQGIAMAQRLTNRKDESSPGR